MGKHSDGGGAGGLATQLARFGGEAITMIPDLARLARGIATDDRVPGRTKVEASLMLGYVISPVNVIPDVIPVLGQLDDAALLGIALRRVIDATGEDVLREHWHGSDRSWRVLMELTEVMGKPGGLLRRARLVKGLVDALRKGEPVRGEGDVVDGEVVSETVEPRDRR